MRCIYTYVRTYNLYTYVSNLKYERPSPPGPSFYLLMQLFGSITVLDICSPSPLFQWVRFGLEAIGPSAAARIG